MDQVEVEFRSYDTRKDPKRIPGYRTLVDADEVPSLVEGGIALPTTKAEAKVAGVAPEEAASVKKS